ncbi:MAG: hypothetical protein JSS96_10725, partial [Bacteroidetes bacterium]|nr:hypothetical protein [Bacteroidota bacterium]
IDNQGRVVWQQQAVFDASSKLHISTNGVARGNYILDISGNLNIGRQKIVVY